MLLKYHAVFKSVIFILKLTSIGFTLSYFWVITANHDIQN